MSRVNPFSTLAKAPAFELKAKTAKPVESDKIKRLARELLDSLETLPLQELDSLWLDKASHRAAQIDAGEVQLVSAEDVDRKARTRLR